MNDGISFDEVTAVRPLGDGSYVADLHPDWSVGERPHGGYLLALLARAATHAVDGDDLAPLSTSAHYLRAPRSGPVLIRTKVLKTGRTVSVLRAVLEQRGQTCVDTTITVGRLPQDGAAWADLPDMPVNPPSTAVDASSAQAGKFFELTRACDLRLDPSGAGFLTGSISEPLRLRMWVRPRGCQPDLLFSLVAGDITVPVTFNLGRIGWSPTVQLTALLRAKPANGWLRLAVESKAVHGQWFDEDTLVIDSTGRLICQARQLALSPLESASGRGS